uniref:Uncharacterized protein n=1 Tax=Oryza rufipogon TaxID=4529 RepID=A0A0E0RHM9_ORYRU
MKSNIMIHKRNLWDLKVLLSRLSSCIPIESTFNIPCYHKRAGYYMHNSAILLESVSKDVLFYGWCSSITIVG